MRRYLVGALCLLPLGIAACGATETSETTTPETPAEVPEGMATVSFKLTGMT